MANDMADNGVFGRSWIDLVRDGNRFGEQGRPIKYTLAAVRWHTSLGNCTTCVEVYIYYHIVWEDCVPLQRGLGQRYSFASR